MATKAIQRSERAAGRTANGVSKSIKSATRRARCVEVADTVRTSQDFAGFMSSLMGDIVCGRIDARTANAACNAGGKLLHVVEMEHKYGRKAAAKETQTQVLQLRQ